MKVMSFIKSNGKVWKDNAIEMYSAVNKGQSVISWKFLEP